MTAAIPVAEQENTDDSCLTYRRTQMTAATPVAGQENTDDSCCSCCEQENTDVSC